MVLTMFASLEMQMVYKLNIIKVISLLSKQVVEFWSLNYF